MAGVVLLGGEHVAELEGGDVVEAELVGGDVLLSSLFGVVGLISLLDTTQGSRLRSEPSPAPQ